MNMKLKPKDNDEMQEAYKLLDGSPSATGVSDAAKGQVPKTDNEQYREDSEEQNEKLYGEDEHEGMMHKMMASNCQDIDEAYACLFESLATIIRSK